jgi:hypothetical protein
MNETNEKKTLKIGDFNKVISKRFLVKDERAFHFAVGSILGDAHLHRTYGHMEWEHRSATFALWKWNLIKELGLVYKANPKGETLYFGDGNGGKVKVLYPLPFKVVNTKTRHKTQKNPSKYAIYRSIRLSTSSLFRVDPKWREKFYCFKLDKNGEPLLLLKKNALQYRKRIPLDIQSYFWDDFALAIWFLDDGWFIPNKHTVAFSTEEWPREEVDILIDCLYKNFNIKSVCYPKNSSNPHHIYVYPRSYAEFYRRVYPTLEDLRVKYPRYAISKSMQHKIIQQPLDQNLIKTRTLF